MIARDSGRWERPVGALLGFTLLELIVVITIIGILGTVVLVNVVDRASDARATKARADLRAIYEAAQQYHVDTGYWPESIEDLVRSTRRSRRKLLIEDPKDPWGNEYDYELVDGRPVIRCLGRDKSPGGIEEDADYQFPAAENDM